MAYTAPGYYLIEPANPTDELSEAIRRFDVGWKIRHSRTDDLLLYHYTTPRGLKGILESRSLWCGHAFYFNDPNEIKYGTDLIHDILIDIRAREVNNEIQTFLEKLSEQLGWTFKGLEYNPFMVCFCESSTMLSQWRSYAAGGMGYCIGFNFSDAIRRANNLEDLSPERRPALRKVIYKEDDQRKLAYEYLEAVIDAVRASRNGGTHRTARWMDVVSVMAAQAVNHLIDMVLCFKRQEYREEREWRLLWVTQPNHLPENLGIRSHEQILSPYRVAYLIDTSEENAPTMPVASIHFGPAQDPSIAKITLDQIIRKYESDNHPIKLNRSDIVIEEPGYKFRWP